MARFLLDTNVPSELNKQKPNAGVVKWIGMANEDDLFLSVVSIAEISRGVERLAGGRRQALLRTWMNELAARFGGRTLPVSTDVAIESGCLEALAMRQGRPLEFADALVAATARIHDLTLVTRNVADFAGLPVEVHNPWS